MKRYSDAKKKCYRLTIIKLYSSSFSLRFSYLLVNRSYLLVQCWCDRAKCTPFILITLFVNSMSRFNEIVLVVVIESIAVDILTIQCRCFNQYLFSIFLLKKSIRFFWRLFLPFICIWMVRWYDVCRSLWMQLITVALDLLLLFF